MNQSLDYPPLCPCPSDQRALQQFRICMSRNKHDKESERHHNRWSRNSAKRCGGEGEKVETTTKKGITVPQTLTSSLPPSQFLTICFDSAWLVVSCRGWRFAPSLRRRRRSRWLVRYTVSCGVLMLNPECRMYTLPGFVVSGKDKVDHIYTRFKGVAK